MLGDLLAAARIDHAQVGLNECVRRARSCNRVSRGRIAVQGGQLGASGDAARETSRTRGGASGDAWLIASKTVALV